jgi:hypothetical protein
MNAAVNAAGELPDEVGINVAKHNISGLGQGADARHILQDPANLQPAEVGRQRQSSLAPELILPAGP